MNRPLTLGSALLALVLFAPDAGADDRVILRDIEGKTNHGTLYQGVAVGDKGKVEARLSIEGIWRKKRFVAPLPAGKKLIGIKLIEAKPGESIAPSGTVGAAGRLEGREGRTPRDRRPTESTFMLVPIVESDFELKVVLKDGAEIDPEKEWLIGEQFDVKAVLGGTAPITTATFEWSVGGNQLKAFDVTVGTKENPLEMIHGRTEAKTAKEQYEKTMILTVTEFAAGDLLKPDLSFWWREEGSGIQEVSVVAHLRYDDGHWEEAALKLPIKVRRSVNPARVAFTKKTLPGGLNILPNHAGWHSAYRGSDKFIMFHREFLRLYNAWRMMFGYLKIMQEYDPTMPAYGEDLANYTYLTEEGGEEASYKHGAKKLGDFKSISDLGDDLEGPFHNRGHMTISRNGGDLRDMGSVQNAPRCEQFFRWHTKVDNVALDYEDLKADENIHKAIADRGPAKDLTANPDDPEFSDLSGMYKVEGKLPDSYTYTGHATLSKLGHNLYLIQGMGRFGTKGLLWRATARRNSETELEVIHHTDLKGITGRVMDLDGGTPPALKAKYTINARTKSFSGDWKVADKTGHATYTPAELPKVTFTPNTLTIRGGELAIVDVKVEPADVLSMVWVEDTGWMTYRVKKSRSAGVKSVYLEGGGSGFYKIIARLGKDPSGAVLAEMPVRVLTMITDEVLKQVQDLAAANLKPIVVFDLDETLFDTRYRTKSILEQFGNEKNELRLKKVEASQIRYTLNDTLRILKYTNHEISNSSVVADARAFVKKRLSEGAYEHDQPVPNGPMYVSKLRKAGAEIIYVAERPESHEDATWRALRQAGYPEGRLILKTRSGSVARWKTDTIRSLSSGGTVVALFDNEPREANAVSAALPSVKVVNMLTRRKPGSPEIAGGVNKLRSF